MRLKALLPAWMPWICKRFKLSPAIEEQLLSISPRQMDRRLAAKKNQKRRRIYGRTKPGYLLKHHIPVKTDSWDVKSPGFTEVGIGIPGAAPSRFPLFFFHDIQNLAVNPALFFGCVQKFLFSFLRHGLLPRIHVAGQAAKPFSDDAAVASADRQNRCNKRLTRVPIPERVLPIQRLGRLWIPGSGDRRTR